MKESSAAATAASTCAFVARSAVPIRCAGELVINGKRFAAAHPSASDEKRPDGRCCLSIVHVSAFMNLLGHGCGSKCMPRRMSRATRQRYGPCGAMQPVARRCRRRDLAGRSMRQHVPPSPLVDRYYTQQRLARRNQKRHAPEFCSDAARSRPAEARKGERSAALLWSSSVNAGEMDGGFRDPAV